MAAYVVKDAQVLYGGVDVSGLMNQVGLDYGVEVQETTTLADSTRSRLAGLLTAELTHQGFWDATLDSTVFADVGGASEVITVLPDAHTVGSRAFFMQTLAASYEQGLDIGEVFAFTLTATGTETLVRGLNLAEGTYTADADSASINLGAVASGSKLFTAMHVLAASGSTPTLDVDIVSDDDGTFDSASTIRHSFDQVTSSVGAQFASVAGPITDAHYRAEFTITGGSPSYDVLIVIGISDK